MNEYLKQVLEEEAAIEQAKAQAWERRKAQLSYLLTPISSLYYTGIAFAKKVPELIGKSETAGAIAGFLVAGGPGAVAGALAVKAGKATPGLCTKTIGAMADASSYEDITGQRYTGRTGVRGIPKQILHVGKCAQRMKKLEQIADKLSQTAGKPVSPRQAYEWALENLVQTQPYSENEAEAVYSIPQATQTPATTATTPAPTRTEQPAEKPEKQRSYLGRVCDYIKSKIKPTPKIKYPETLNFVKPYRDELAEAQERQRAYELSNIYSSTA